MGARGACQACPLCTPRVLLRSCRAMSASESPSPIPAGQRVYAVGDVHGCRDRLADLHAEIARHDKASAPAEVTVVHLGDLVDRGPDSAGAVAAVMAGPPVPGAHHVVLMGN